jgi:hypothetical protein
VALGRTLRVPVDVEIPGSDELAVELLLVGKRRVRCWRLQRFEHWCHFALLVSDGARERHERRCAQGVHLPPQ